MFAFIICYDIKTILHTHTHIYIYIYIYVCMYVCICIRESVIIIKPKVILKFTEQLLYKYISVI